LDKYDFNKQHDDLLERFRTRIEDHFGGPTLFNKDGIINLELWQKAPRKILFINKETNNDYKAYKDYTYDVRSVIEKSATQMTGWRKTPPLRRIGRLAHGFLYCTREGYPSLEEAIENQWLGTLSCAYINLKKTNGKATAKPKEIDEHTAVAGHLLREQIELINPDIVLCGKTYTFLANHVLENAVKLDHYLYQDGRRLYINCDHPSAHSLSNDRLYNKPLQIFLTHLNGEKQD
jgi:hypothetical protein